MRASRLAIALVLASAPLISHAEIVSYTFSANVWDMFTSDAVGFTDVNASNLPGSLVSMGDRLTGQITYDTSHVPDYISADGASASYMGAIKSLSFKFDATALQYQSAGLYNVTYVNAHPDGHNYNNIGFTTGNNTLLAYTSAFLMLGNFGQALNSLAIPSELSLGTFPSMQVGYVWEAPDRSVRLFTSANIDTWTQASAVPEPSSWAMLSIGVAALAALARRQRRA